MQDPITRVLTALEILQARDQVTGAELAKRLDVDLRTVQRYVARLRELNIPVEASPGVGGSYRLRPGYRLPPLLLSNDEAFALSLGLRALRQIGLEALAPATEGARAKLARVSPVALRESLEAVEEAVLFEPSAWLAPTPAASVLMVAAAIRTGHRLGFTYLSHAGATTRRELEPYAVLHTDDRWYMMGHCLDRSAVRTFRLDRVSELQSLPERFTRPEAFDARAYLAERLPFLQSEYQVDVWIDLPEDEARRSFALWRVAMEAEGVGTRLRCGRDDLRLFAAMLLSTGRKVMVREPVELRETFREMSGAAAAAAVEPA